MCNGYTNSTTSHAQSQTYFAKDFDHRACCLEVEV